MNITEAIKGLNRNTKVTCSEWVSDSHKHKKYLIRPDGELVKTYGDVVVEMFHNENRYVMPFMPTAKELIANDWSVLKR